MTQVKTTEKTTHWDCRELPTKLFSARSYFTSKNTVLIVGSYNNNNIYSYNPSQNNPKFEIISKFVDNIIPMGHCV